VDTYQQAVHRLRDALGREPTDDELSGELDVSREELKELQWEVSHTGSVPIEPAEDDEEGESSVARSLAAPASEDALNSLERREKIRDLKAAVAALSEKERLVIALYYDENLTFREIGTALGVSESRVCQLHTRAVGAIQRRIKEERV
jgi:RNA polymerase sigma factor for flagellar operon FliA